MISVSGGIAVSVLDIALILGMIYVVRKILKKKDS